MCLSVDAPHTSPGQVAGAAPGAEPGLAEHRWKSPAGAPCLFKLPFLRVPHSPVPFPSYEVEIKVCAAGFRRNQPLSLAPGPRRGREAMATAAPAAARRCSLGREMRDGRDPAVPRPRALPASPFPRQRGTSRPCGRDGSGAEGVSALPHGGGRGGRNRRRVGTGERSLSEGRGCSRAGRHWLPGESSCPAAGRGRRAGTSRRGGGAGRSHGSSRWGAAGPGRGRRRRGSGELLPSPRLPACSPRRRGSPSPAPTPFACPHPPSLFLALSAGAVCLPSQMAAGCAMQPPVPPPPLPPVRL